MRMLLGPKVNGRSDLKLQLGCFDQPAPGWINTDITPHIFVARFPGLPFILYKAGLLNHERYQQHRNGVFKAVNYLDATAKFPFDDDMIECVFSSHFLEHLYRDQARFCIREVFRVLRPGGVFRIAVPDLDKVVAEYDPENPEEFCEGIFEASEKGDKNQHHWHYNETSLKRVLKSVGFSEIYRCEFKEGRCADVQIIDNRPGSLFMEAVK